LLGSKIIDRIEFPNLRITLLEQSIHSSKKMINLCRIVKDLDGQTKKADRAELERRIRIDKELSAARQAELGE
jgi:hypothetical protein